uniref:Major facilitator superfamily (MFS) profile domain-containing protein n=1 Tax=Timema douglasi TaxID=61478 RepID=A0A7R8VNE9_TIMDO|nr:unnamed protein product [Timema douglasi]
MYFFWRRRRYMVAMLAFFGFFNVYALRVNFSVAIVAMTSNRTVEENGTNVEYAYLTNLMSSVSLFRLSTMFIVGVPCSVPCVERLFHLGSRMDCAVRGTFVSPRFSDLCSSLVCLVVCRAWNVCFTSVLGLMFVISVPCSVPYVERLFHHGSQMDGPEFDWDSKIQGLLLSSFFFGYICTQILGGWLASRVGGNKVYGIGIAATSILTIVMPAVTYFPDHAVIPMIILVRVVEGLFERCDKNTKASTSFLLYDCSKISPENKGTRLLQTCNSAICDRDEEQGYFGPVPALPVTWRSRALPVTETWTFSSAYLIRGPVRKSNSSFRLSETGVSTDPLTSPPPNSRLPKDSTWIKERSESPGVTYPCIHAVWARWAPPLERSRMASLAFAGSYVGTVVSLPVCGLLANELGWPSIFYVFGVVGLIWFIIWMYVVKEGPEMDPKISPQELEYLQNILGQTDKNLVHPWRAFFTSMPVWAVIVAHFCENWGFYTLLTQLPTFMKGKLLNLTPDALEFNLKKAGFMSALPYLVMAIVLSFSGQLADYLITNKYLNTSQTSNMCSLSAVFMLMTCFLLTPTGAVSCLTAAVGLGAFAWSGFSVNHLDIAPQHASVLMGLSNTMATLPGIISPSITGILVQNKTVNEWRVVFYMASFIYLFGALFYGAFSSGEIQPWAEHKINQDRTKIDEK